MGCLDNGPAQSVWSFTFGGVLLPHGGFIAWIFRIVMHNAGG